MTDDLTTLRVEYESDGLHAAGLGADPMEVFGAWFADAAASDGVPEPNAMALATVSRDGWPSNRMVLLKRFDRTRASFTWFTSLDGRKGIESRDTGVGALCWWWPAAAGRQVRAVGRIELVERADVQAYYEQRPASARIGAAVSQQSRAVANRAVLEARAQALQEAPQQAPDSWGGLRLVADELEFWQGSQGRLHDRISYLRLDPASGAPCAAAAVEAAGGLTQLRSAGTEVVDRHGTAWLRVRLEP